MTEDDLSYYPDRFARNWISDRIAETLERADPTSPPQAGVEGAERLRELVTAWQTALVATLRAIDPGSSWADVAHDVGITRQAAWSRWRHYDPGSEVRDPDVRDLHERIATANEGYVRLVDTDPAAAFTFAYGEERAAIIDFVRGRCTWLRGEAAERPAPEDDGRVDE